MFTIAGKLRLTGVSLQIMRRNAGGSGFGCGAAETFVAGAEYLFIVCHFENVGTTAVNMLKAGRQYPHTPPLLREYT